MIYLYYFSDFPQCIYYALTFKPASHTSSRGIHHLAMSVDLVQNQPASPHHQQQQQTAPQSEYLEPNTPEVIEMKSSVNFSRLPQDLPPAPPVFQYGGDMGKHGIPMIIAPVANGKSC